MRIIDDEKGWEVGESLGTTPLDIPIGIAIQNGEAWFKDPNVLGGKIWQMQKRLHRHDLNFFVSKREYYGVFVHMKVEFEIRPNGDLMVQECETDSYSHPVHVGQKETIKAAPRPIGLLEHASKAAPQLARLIEDGAYYDAEELRLKRTQSLREQLDRNEVFWVHYADDLKRMPTTMTTRVQEQLIKSELQQLNHLVGLLDPQLMGLRKQLLAKLHEGDVDSALVLANAVETMEKRYYPPESKTVYTEIRTPSSPQPTQVGQADGKQEILIQQKPYYGAANIVEALGAMRGTKLDPAAYQKALGGAQLLDIMGFGSMINK